MPTPCNWVGARHHSLLPPKFKGSSTPPTLLYYFFDSLNRKWSFHTHDSSAMTKYMIRILKLVIINCDENKKDDRLLENSNEHYRIDFDKLTVLL